MLTLSANKSKENVKVNVAYNILTTTYELPHVIYYYDELSSLNFNAGINNEVMSLDEDLLMISFSNGMAVDVGWYPSFEESGEFVMMVIKDQDWDSPLLKLTAGWDKLDLSQKIKQAIDISKN